MKSIFINKSYKPGFTISNPRQIEDDYHKTSFNNLNRKQRRYIERKMKEDKNEA